MDFLFLEKSVWVTTQRIFLMVVYHFPQGKLKPLQLIEKFHYFHFVVNLTSMKNYITYHSLPTSLTTLKSVFVQGKFKFQVRDTTSNFTLNTQHLFSTGIQSLGRLNLATTWDFHGLKNINSRSRSFNISLQAQFSLPKFIM